MDGWTKGGGIMEERKENNIEACVEYGVYY